MRGPGPAGEGGHGVYVVGCGLVWAGEGPGVVFGDIVDGEGEGCGGEDGRGGE